MPTAEAPDSPAATPGTRDAYTRAEMAAAVTELFKNRDRHPILPMLRDDVVLKVPATLPYGGEFTTPDAFDRFFAGTPAAATSGTLSPSTSTRSSNPTITSSFSSPIPQFPRAAARP